MLVNPSRLVTCTMKQGWSQESFHRGREICWSHRAVKTEHTAFMENLQSTSPHPSHCRNVLDVNEVARKVDGSAFYGEQLPLLYFFRGIF